MKKFIKILKFIFLLIPSLIGAYFGWILRYAHNPEKYPFEQRYAKFHKLMLKVAKHSSMELRVDNKKLLDELEDGSLIVANHQSAMDIILIGALSERPISFISKKENEKTPLVGKCIKIINGIFIDREDPVQTVKCFKIAEENMTKGITYVIYPEGTRNKNPIANEIGEFHSGSFRLGVKANKGVLLMATFGQFRVLSNDYLYKSYLVQVNFLTYYKPDVFLKMSTGDLSMIARDTINDDVERMKVLDKEYEDQKLYKNKAKKWWKK